MLRKLIILIGALLLLVVVVGTAGFAYLSLRKPETAPALSIKVDRSPARIARGKYIFEVECDCTSCHSQRDFTLVGGPQIESGRGAGNLLSDFLKGLPGKVVAPNITPDMETGIGTWTDGEKIRAIREGVDKDGNTLFPMMPYQDFRHMNDEDVQALVAYLDSIPPVKHALPKGTVNFPVNLMMKGAPRPAGVVPPPDRTNRLKYGEYLVTVSGCRGCHTPEENGRAVLEKDFAGGSVFDTTAGKVLSANITPDTETGIGKWSEDFFVSKFYDFKPYAEKGCPKLPGPEAFTLMPWLPYSQKSREELGAIYAYLRTIKPLHNYVEIHPGFPNKAPAVP